MSNKIIINLKRNFKDKNIQFLNNNNECIICNEILNRMDDLILTNNFCRCYIATKICLQCFIKWIRENKECIICRRKFINDNIHMERIENNISSYENSVYISINNVYLNNINDDLNESKFRIITRWCNKIKYKFLFYFILFTFSGFFLLSFEMSLKYKDYTNITLDK